MSGIIQAIAVDLDGTLTAHGQLSAEALSAIAAVRDEGVAVLLVTGRILRELTAAFPGIPERFDAVVAENGAVLAMSDGIRDVADRVEDALERQAIAFRRGRVLLAGAASDAEAILDAIGSLGLDCQLVRNRGELMVLPAGVSKGSGLLAALEEFGISPHNVVAIGDAENDLSLLHAAEFGVAVGNAVPSLREHADLVLEEPDGAGVAALLRGPLLNGGPIGSPRRSITIGTLGDGTPATIPAAAVNVLICGQTGVGKSFVAGRLMEEWITAGYTLLVIDMEGEHTALRHLHDTVVLDSQPTPVELLSVLRQQSLSVILDVSALAPAVRLEYLRTLPPIIEAERAAWGLPHWIVVDEAHETLTEAGIAADVFRPADRGYCLVTFHPELLCADALAAIDITITVDPPSVGQTPSGEGHTATLRRAGSTERPFVVGTRRTDHVRHRRKYATVALPRSRWFTFRDAAGQPVATAADLAQFSQRLQTLDSGVLDHHLRHGDFSRWLIGSVQDRELAASVGAIERRIVARRASELLQARDRLVDEINSRYLTD